MTDSSHWQDCIRVFLHDSPDKALCLSTKKAHVKVAERYQAAALGLSDEAIAEVGNQREKIADWLAAAVERLPLPDGTAKIEPNNIKHTLLERVHPSSGSRWTGHEGGEAQAIDEKTIAQRCRRIAAITEPYRKNGQLANEADARLAAFALWRLIDDPECGLPKVCELPADTRQRDHSIRDHLDTCVAAFCALHDGQAGLMSFSLGPVQDFISQGRSVRDLWTGSYLLSWLTFHAMIPIIEEIGPWAIMSPGLRRNPLLDWWLRGQGVNNVAMPTADKLRVAGLPNTFTAWIPWERQQKLRSAVIEAVQTEWKKIGLTVQSELNKIWGSEWSQGWDGQMDAVWDVRAVAIPSISRSRSDGTIGKQTDSSYELWQTLYGELPEEIVKAKAIAEKIPDKPKNKGGKPLQQRPGLWCLDNIMLQKSLDAVKRMRRILPHEKDNESREKCSMFGSHAVMGPVANTAENKKWWTEKLKGGDLSALIKANERLCAPALVKRLASATYFKKLLQINEIPDTREIARCWWEHNGRPPESQGGRDGDGADGPKYYAVLAMDGDDMGKFLRGEKGPSFIDAYHSDMTNYLMKAGVTKEQLAVKRPAGPAANLAFADCLNHFAQRCPELITQLGDERKRKDFEREISGKKMAISRTYPGFVGYGHLIYAGGDDVLAILPVATAFETACVIAEVFSQHLPTASMSAGIAIVHEKDDMRMAIKEARQAEALAKRTGKKACGIRVIRRSGEVTEIVSPWSLLRDWIDLASDLVGLSPRWTYQIAEERLALRECGNEAIWKRIQYIINHGDGGKQIDRMMVSRLNELWASMDAHYKKEHFSDGEIADLFIEWCMAAGWLSRYVPAAHQEVL